MKVTRRYENRDLADVRVMLCDVCQRALANIRQRQPGTHSGQQPQYFSHAPRANVWTGSHHTGNDSFLNSVRGRCYICYPVLQACPAKTRQYAVYFRTFFEIELSGPARYSMRIRVEVPELSALFEPEVIELHGSFKLLPKSGGSTLFVC